MRKAKRGVGDRVLITSRRSAVFLSQCSFFHGLITPGGGGARVKWGSMTGWSPLVIVSPLLGSPPLLSRFYIIEFTILYLVIILICRCDDFGLIDSFDLFDWFRLLLMIWIGFVVIDFCDCDLIDGCRDLWWWMVIIDYSVQIDVFEWSTHTGQIPAILRVRRGWSLPCRRLCRWDPQISALLLGRSQRDLSSWIKWHEGFAFGLAHHG